MNRCTNFCSRLLLPFMIVLAAGCTINPYTGEKEASNTAKGAGMGALAGAALGAAVGEEEAVMTGAAAGAAIGGGIGYYQDRQESKLRQQLQATGVRVKRVGNTIRLIMPGNVTFETDSSQLQPSFRPVLDSVVEVVTEFDQTLLEIKGYTDSTGSFAHNQKLSEDRAHSVADYFTNAGVARSRIRTTGYGERNPIASNDTAVGRAKNRRVEIDLQPMNQ